MGDGRWTYIILLLFTTEATGSSVWRTSKEEKKIHVYNVVIEKETDPAHLNYSNIDYVQLWYPKINTFTTEMQSQITNVRKLDLANGTVPTVHIAAHFKVFYISHCSVSSVIINPSIAYEIEVLAVFFNNLKKLPKHLNAMKKLKILYLNDNQIEFVDMADFNGLNYLEKISLFRNKITEISADPVVLPKLMYFFIEQNHLRYINFENWNTTNLKGLYFNKNQLLAAFGVLSAFPKLTETSLSGNPFNCQWFNATFKELKKRKVKFVEENLTTCNDDVANLIAYNKIKFHYNLVNKQQLENTKKLVQEHLENMKDKLSSSIHENEKEINSFKQLYSTKEQLENAKTEFKKSVQVLNTDINSIKITQKQYENANANTFQDLKSELDSLKQFKNTAIAEIEQLKHKNDDLTEELYLQTVALDQKTRHEERK